METELHDLGEKMGEVSKAEPQKKYYSPLMVNQKQVPELEDYDLGDEVHLEIVAKVTSIRQQEKGKKEMSLEMRKGRVLNLKDGRKKAMERGLSKKSSDEIDKKRNK